MLKTAERLPVRRFKGRIAIVASRYNLEHVDGLLRGASEVLVEAGARVEVVRVPGAFEIPVAVSALLEREVEEPEAIVCLGLIWKGETNHAEHIGGAVTQALMELSWTTGVPVIHEVITVSTEDQARVRCLEPGTNRGTEAAHTALDILRTLEEVRSPCTPPENPKPRR